MGKKSCETCGEDGYDIVVFGIDGEPFVIWGMPCIICKLNPNRSSHWKPRPEVGYGLRPGPGRKHPDDEPEVEKPSEAVKKLLSDDAKAKLKSLKDLHKRVEEALR
jgi:hypothetical protein